MSQPSLLVEGADAPRVRRALRWSVMIAGVLLLVIGIAGGKFAIIKASMASMSPPPPPAVTTQTVQFEDWDTLLDTVGSLRAARGVDLATEVAGAVRTVHVRSGDRVAAGAVLVELNADAERAQLASLQALADLSRMNLKRDREQFAVHFVSQAAIDSDEADLNSKLAQVEQQKAVLDKKTLRAPFAGRVGIVTVNPGQYLNSGDKVLSLQAVDSLYADFSVPQRELARVAPGARVAVSADAWPGRRFEGRVSAPASAVDAATRNLQVEATLANPGGALLPGMFVRVALVTGKPEKHISVPQSSLSYNAYGTTMFVVDHAKDDKGAEVLKARQVFVTTGSTRGDLIAVLTGLKAGDEIVTSGQLKLKGGAVLRVDNTRPPVAEGAPHPQEH